MQLKLFCRIFRIALERAVTLPMFLMLSSCAHVPEEHVPSSPDELLVEAAFQGNLSHVKSLISSGVDPNSRNQNVNALGAAAYSDKTEIVAILLSAGADPNAVNNNIAKTSPVHFAAKNDNVEMVDLLVAYGANPLQQESSGLNSLGVAIDNNSFNAFNGIWEHLQLDATTMDPYIVALAESGRFSTLRYLIDSISLDMDRVLIEGSVFTYASFFASVGCLPCFTEGMLSGVDFRKYYQSAYHPLTMAVANNHAPLVSYLLENNVSPNLGRGGPNPLLEAVHQKNQEILVALLKHGADPDRVHDAMPALPLGYAAATGCKNCIKYLCNFGADPNRFGIRSAPPAVSALVHEDSAILEEIIACGADVSMVHNGIPLVSHAAALAKAVHVDLLIRKGANVQALDSKGCYPIHYSSMTNNQDAIESLANSGADINATCSTGETALDLAKANGHSTSAKKLISLGGLSKHEIDALIDKKSPSKADSSQPEESKIRQFVSSAAEAIGDGLKMGLYIVFELMAWEADQAKQGKGLINAYTEGKKREAAIWDDHNRRANTRFEIEAITNQAVQDCIRRIRLLGNDPYISC